jgi:hypothetical protein
LTFLFRRGEKLVTVAVWNPMPERIKKKGGRGKKETDKTREVGEEMKEVKEEKDRDEVRSILADSSRDRVTLVFLFIPYFSPWLKLPLFLPPPHFFHLSLSRSLPSHSGFRSICSRGVIYSLRGNKGISHISLIFTLHNSTSLSLSLSVSHLSLKSHPQESVHR